MAAGQGARWSAAVCTGKTSRRMRRIASRKINIAFALSEFSNAPVTAVAAAERRGSSANRPPESSVIGSGWINCGTDVMALIPIASVV